MKTLLNHKTIVALLLLAGISLQPAMAQTVRTPSPEGASVRISNIENKATLPTTFLVKFEVTGMEVVPAGDNTPNSGHHHLMIDVQELATASQPLPATDKIIHYGAGQTEAEITLKPGRHTLQLMFADANHVPFDPLVMSDQIDIIVVDESKEAPAKK
ncbi:MAG TPA: DUF4399 domain-containing protein [Xanthomonadales bacterium]|nr:DUF4399 domain-containing protein [Xanthomonadales bacterium]